MVKNTWELLKGNRQWVILMIGVAVVCGMFVSIFPEKQLDFTNIAYAEAKTAVTVVVDDVVLDVQTSKNDVAGVIKELGLYIGENDKVNPSLDTTLAETNFIEILRAPKKAKVEIASDERIISREGYAFSYEKIIEDAELTAYSAGYEHTNKNPGDPLYGITFTGTTVEDGRTVAVDPKVIPLGWWMYIEGIGYRKAEDTGSAVKNKRVDIYYDDNDIALKFGLKKNVKIYLIGPNPPMR